MGKMGLVGCLGVLVREAHDRPLLFSFYDAIGDHRS